METITLRIDIDAPKQAAWDLLADYANPHTYVCGITNAYAMSENERGVGAVRYCDLPPLMGMKQNIVEEVTEWVEGESLSYAVTRTTAPVTDGHLTWRVSGDDQRSAIEVDVTYRPKGVIGKLLRSKLRKEFPKQMREALRDMKRVLE
jgi:uncharacterized membrane protein